MAKAKFGLEFDGFLELAERIDRMGGEKLKTAVENALTKSKEQANKQISKAMGESPYQFAQGRTSDKGVGGVSTGNGKNRPATGKAKKSHIVRTAGHGHKSRMRKWNGMGKKPSPRSALT